MTRRLRRAAPFNFELAKRAVHLNGATQAAITKLDVVFPEAARMKKFEQLPSKARDFIKETEKAIGIPVTLIGTGPSSEDLIDRMRRRP